MQNPTSPAGWYPDPAGTGRMRYFDGGQWTDYYAGAPSAPTQPGQPQYAGVRPHVGHTVPQRRSRLRYFTVPIVLVALFGLAGAFALFQRINPFNIPEFTYMNHVKDGIGGSIPGNCGHREPRDSCMNEDLIEYLGEAVCDSLDDGTSADEEVRRVAAREVVGRRNGEIIVYYAITDLCPDHMSQRRDEWAP